MPILNASKRLTYQYSDGDGCAPHLEIEGPLGHISVSGKAAKDAYYFIAASGEGEHLKAALTKVYADEHSARLDERQKALFETRSKVEALRKGDVIE